MDAAENRTLLAGTHGDARSRHLLRLSSDERLVQRVRAGSEPAFAALYERHYRKVLSFCRHMLGSPEEAEDAVQQAFANAYRDMLGDDKELNFRPWLYRIARNQCISMLRARRAAVELAETEPSAVGLSREVADRQELRELLRDLAALPDDQREALVLAELHDNSHPEVAEIIGCEPDKVKSLVFQARSSLIKSREARETPCEEIRAQLSVLRGGSLRRNTIRRHLRDCDGCRAYRSSVKHQRQALAALLPVIPSSALKLGAANAVAAAGAAGVASQGPAAGGALSGPLTALAGKLGVSALVVKGTATVAAVTVAAGGGTVAVKQVEERVAGAKPPALEASPRVPRTEGVKPGVGAPATLAPGAPDNTREKRDRRMGGDVRRRREIVTGRSGERTRKRVQAPQRGQKPFQRRQSSNRLSPRPKREAITRTPRQDRQVTKPRQTEPRPMDAPPGPSTTPEVPPKPPEPAPRRP